MDFLRNLAEGRDDDDFNKDKVPGEEHVSCE